MECAQGSADPGQQTYCYGVLGLVGRLRPGGRAGAYERPRAAGRALPFVARRVFAPPGGHRLIAAAIPVVSWHDHVGDGVAAAVTRGAQRTHK